MVNGDREEILGATDLVELIGETVKLRRAGRSYQGLCPFHSEKTPSFTVDPVKRIFYCFGCKAGSNAIDFVMRRDGVEFIEALRYLAERAGITLAHQDNRKASERQQLLDVCALACDHFHALLKSNEGQAAREYLAARGFAGEAVARFTIGFAPAQWDRLLRQLKQPPELLLKAGLVKRSESGRHYDVFRNRIIFPIRDEQGRTIAFGGRVMPESEDPAKYLNSPETPLFSKGRAVYGLHLARQKIVETRTAIVVEGYCDVIGCHQSGATNVVATLGTSLTPPHLQILGRFADRVVLLFDPDSAGERAVDHALELGLTQDLDVSVASLPEAMDPDEYMAAHGLPAFEAVIARAQDALEFKWRLLRRQYRGAGLAGQQRALEEYLALLWQMRDRVNPLRWSMALAQVSRLSGVAVYQLAMRSPQAKAEPEQDAHPPRLDAQAIAERNVLAAVLLIDRWWLGVRNVIRPGHFVGEQTALLAQRLWDHWENEGSLVVQEFIAELPEAMRALATELMIGSEDPEADGRAGVEYLLYARERREAETIRARLAIDGDAALKQLEEIARHKDLRRTP